MRVVILAGELEARVNDVRPRVALYCLLQLRRRRNGCCPRWRDCHQLVVTELQSWTTNDAKLTTSYSTAGGNSTWSDSLQMHTVWNATADSL